MSYQSSLKIKWYSSGVVRALLFCEIIDFTGFFGTLQDIAVANE